jgi:two-component system response regulator YesN
MYKVLLVDDEWIIREGIGSIIDWEENGFLLIGAAQNGIEAYEMILNNPPQIEELFQKEQKEELQNLKSLEQIQEFLKTSGGQLAPVNQENIVIIRSKLVRSIIQYVQDHLENEELSLKWLSSQVIYMNDGYLSKLFIKETGEKFSHYLMRVRMEKAKELIINSDDDLVYEVARKVGFGNNPQYFSQLFKKYTGWSPSEYKKDELK